MGTNPRAYQRQYQAEYRRVHKQRDYHTQPANDVLPEIIAWDGEGTTAPDGTPQPYVLLMNSLGGEWYERNGLSTMQIFRALMEYANSHKHALHFIYGGSYDTNMWLRDLPERALRDVWQTGSTVWNGFYIEYRPRKMFKLKHLGSALSITIWDAFPWCQSSFVKAVTDYLGADYEDLPLIREGKARRSTFDESERNYIRKYTSAELVALVRLCQGLIIRLHSAGIYVRRWDGPGAAAAAILRERGIRAHKAETPEGVKYAAAVAYSGGRIELLQYGNYEKPVYHYDIHSAYPAAMEHLPSLAHGTWAHHTRKHPLQDTALYHLQWHAPAVGKAVPFYPFPFRTEDGSIYYPGDGESWIWGPEYIAYLENRTRFDIEVECVESYTFTPATDTQPFTWVREMYDLRQQWKREGNAAEWALKLGLNSLYGKLAQTVGWSLTRKPPYYQLEWAGLITSYTRAQLMRAACNAPGACVMFATDGVFATEPLPVSEGGALGEWESATHQGITAVQSGVYWIRDDDWRVWSRGYNPEELVRDNILAAWNARTQTLQIPQTRFLTLGSALAGSTISPAWRSWKTAPRDLQLGPTGKRVQAAGRARATIPARGLVRTLPAYLSAGANLGVSTPYERAWKEGLRDTVDGVPLLVYEDEVMDTGV